MQPILVTGGTGALGRLVVPRLRDAGRQVRVLSRRGHQDADGIEFATGDLATGEGIEAAAREAEVVVHCAGSSKGDEVKTRQLVAAAARAGTRHLVFISVVGADRVPVTSRLDRAMFGYFASKLAAERTVAGSGLPWTTLRATQFHTLSLLTARQLARLPVIPVAAGFRFQPVDPGEVADRLVELALGGLFGREVAEHGPVERAGHRDPVGPDDRDEHQVPGPGPPGRLDQVAGLDLVAFGAAGQMHDHLGPRHRGVDALAGGQVTGQLLDARAALAAVAAEHPDLAAGRPQPRDDLAAQGAGDAGDQNGWRHCVLLVTSVVGAGSPP